LKRHVESNENIRVRLPRLAPQPAEGEIDMDIIHAWIDYFATIITEQNIRIATTYATFLGVSWTFLKTRWNNQKITIIAVNAETDESTEVARLPRFQVTRGEVLGIMRLQAGGAHLNTSCFEWNETIPREARFKFPPDTYAMISGKVGAPVHA
jgi:hypothetical protein